MVYVWGGGGGGGGSNNGSDSITGGTGGTSSFGSYCYATGGQGGTRTTGGAGGAGYNGDAVFFGSSGLPPSGNSGGAGGAPGKSNTSNKGYGGKGADYKKITNEWQECWRDGDTGNEICRTHITYTYVYATAGGGGGGYVEKWIDVQGVSSVSVTVGAGGVRVKSGVGTSSSGTPGLVIVEEYK